MSTELRAPVWGNLGAVLFLDARQRLDEPLGLQPERPALRRRTGAALQDADRAVSPRRRLPAQSDPRPAGRRQGTGAAPPVPLQHRPGVLEPCCRPIMQSHPPSAPSRRVRRHAAGRHPRAGAHRVADAVVQGLAPALHRARVEAVPERRARDRQPRRQPAVRRRAGRRRGGRVGRADRRREGAVESTTASSSWSRTASSSTRSRSISRSCASSATPSGWNLARLVKRERKEANREGPRRRLAAVDRDHRRERVDRRSHAPRTFKLPSRIEGLNVKAGFEYAPVHYSVRSTSSASAASAPDFIVQQLTGKIAVRDDNLYLDGIALKTTRDRAEGRRRDRALSQRTRR